VLTWNATLAALPATDGEGGYWFANALRFGDSFGAQLVLDFLIAGLALVAAVLVRHVRPRYGLNPWALCLTLGTLGVIAASTLTRRAGATSPGHLQLDPFHTLSRYLYDPADLLIYLGGNIAMFVPLGLFMYLAVRRWMLLCAVAGTAVSVAVEILQLPIYSRSSDIDDVITNGLGALIGAVLGAILVRAARAGWLGERGRTLIDGERGRTLQHMYPRTGGPGSAPMRPVPGETWPGRDGRQPVREQVPQRTSR